MLFGLVQEKGNKEKEVGKTILRERHPNGNDDNNDGSMDGWQESGKEEKRRKEKEKKGKEGKEGKEKEERILIREKEGVGEQRRRGEEGP
eukprot:CAMPEP_0201541858 /NCGR_PEP_ID=MMETSP0161_2-20130828/71701_1 /ASSEMBLY_ACC=CAM_ASM_000251 /TAXON_ID=180227 /ORGANISM="Neoparamoeba aestuarina, Strain SoJaBio B1-5/56/2" /LENGTH=89 /DNA_ID=CAMNT_0047949423 /DNA_START=1 /DNA_END=271 /DNA_ORIENTATION=-